MDIQAISADVTGFRDQWWARGVPTQRILNDINGLGVCDALAACIIVYYHHHHHKNRP
jgi:hypothetical protein